MLLDSDGPWRVYFRSLEDGATGICQLLKSVSFSLPREGPQGSPEGEIREYLVAASLSGGSRQE